jgi:hypothetical protein
MGWAGMWRASLQVYFGAGPPGESAERLDRKDFALTLSYEWILAISEDQLRERQA